MDNENLGDASRLEGYLFPDTYEFYVGARPELAFNSMLSNFNKKVYGNDELEELFEASAYPFERCSPRGWSAPPSPSCRRWCAYCGPGPYSPSLCSG